MRAPRAAAVAGIVFSLLLIASVVLVRVSVPSDLRDRGAWLTSPSGSQVALAMNLVPIAGVAFLWFIGVLRDRLGAREDKLFATVFLGSGLLFVAMLFIAASLLGTLLVLVERGFAVDGESVLSLQVLTRQLMGSFGARMAAVFTISVTSVGLRNGLMPKPLAVLGYVAGVLLLLSPPITAWSQLVFPSWVLAFSLYILVTSRRAAR